MTKAHKITKTWVKSKLKNIKIKANNTKILQGVKLKDWIEQISQTSYSKRLTQST